MKTLSVVAILVSSLAHASSVQCPNLQGKFFCKGVAGSHKDMVMTVRAQLKAGYVQYAYTYEQEGQEPMTLVYQGNDQGIKYSSGGDEMVGRCMLNYYFNSKDGKLIENKTLLNYINNKGDYSVRAYKSDKLYLVCPRIKN